MVTSKYMARSAYVQADLHQSFLDMHCAKGGDIREFLSSLCYKKEELAAAGISITTKEYEHTILHSIPSDLATFVSQILFSALLINTSSSININALINQINEEAEWLKSRHSRRHLGQGEKKESATDKALTATGSEGGKKHCQKGNCHNCGKARHWARECHSPKKEKNKSIGTMAVQSLSTSYKPENKPVGLANTITLHDFEGNGFWMAKEEVIDPMPLVSTEPDPMLGAPDEINVVPHPEGEERENQEETILTDNEWFGAAVIPGDESDNQVRIELYDLGAT